MIITVEDKTFCVVVPQKCGISSVLSILGYKRLQEVTSKKQTRINLQNNNELLHIGGFNEPNYIKENNIQVNSIIGIVRDPIERFISAYKDRVIKKNIDQFKNKDIEYLIDHLPNLIRSKTDFGLHCRPQTWWLGYEACYYDKIFWTSEINTIFRNYIQSNLNIAVPNVYQNRSFNRNYQLSTKHTNKLIEFYENDIKFIQNMHRNNE